MCLKRALQTCQIPWPSDTRPHTHTHHNYCQSAWQCHSQWRQSVLTWGSDRPKINSPTLCLMSANVNIIPPLVMWIYHKPNKRVEERVEDKPWQIGGDRRESFKRPHCVHRKSHFQKAIQNLPEKKKPLCFLLSNDILSFFLSLSVCLYYLTLSLSHSLSLSLSLSFTLTLSLSLSRVLSNSVSLTLFLSNSLFLILLLCPSVEVCVAHALERFSDLKSFSCVGHTHTHTHTRTHTHTHIFMLGIIPLT